MIQRIMNCWRLFALLLAVVGIGGCASEPPKHDLLAERAVQVELVANDRLELVQPTVSRQGNIVTITGKVARKSATSDVPGYLDLLLFNDKHELISEDQVFWQPQKLPPAGQYSEYYVQLLQPLPEHAILRVAYDDGTDTANQIMSSQAAARSGTVRTPQTPGAPHQPTMPGMTTHRGSSGRGKR
jgi:hypothetical protein